MTAHELLLDRQVRDWVLIPLTIFMILMKLLMQYFHQMMSPPDSNAGKKPEAIKEVQAVARSQRLRQYGGYIPESSFRPRKEFFVAKEKGVFHQKTVSKPSLESMTSDPTMMVDGMKRSLTSVIPQLVMGAWVNFFFSGFVMGRVPLSLSPRFKPMLQRGVDLQSLDVSYFTSLSYYIMLLLALRGPFSLVFREDTLDDAEMMRRQMNPMAGPAFDAANAFNAELKALEAVDHEFALEDIEQSATAILKKLSASLPSVK